MLSSFLESWESLVDSVEPLGAVIDFSESLTLVSLAGLKSKDWLATVSQVDSSLSLITISDNSLFTEEPSVWVAGATDLNSIPHRIFQWYGLVSLAGILCLWGGAGFCFPLIGRISVFYVPSHPMLGLGEDLLKKVNQALMLGL